MKGFSQTVLGRGMWLEGSGPWGGGGWRWLAWGGGGSGWSWGSGGRESWFFGGFLG